MYKYATKGQKMVVFISIILSLGHGVMMPLFAVIFGAITEDFTPDKNEGEIEKMARKNAFLLFGVAGIAFVLSAISYTLLKIVGAKVSEKLRKEYFKKILEQEIGWFDKENPEKLTTNYTEEFAAFSTGCGISVQIYFFAFAMALGGVVIGFILGWLYSLYILLTLPIMFIGMGAFISVIMKQAEVTKVSYANAGATSEQALSAIKTVFSLNGQEHEAGKYMCDLVPAKEATIKFGMVAAFFFGLFFFSIFAEYGFGYWIGAQMIKTGKYNHNVSRDYNVKDIISIFFAVLTGGFALGQLGPSAQAITKARQAGYHIYKVIERAPTIPICDDTKKKADNSLKGDIEFRNVCFSYPSRDDVQVLNNLTFKIKAGQKAAFVGETGCGKSTTIQLVERYYDAQQGEVMIDGLNIKDYNLKSLRNFIGYVGQEPVLFAMSIRDNLLLAKPEATEAEIEQALKLANAYDFIMALEKKLDTYVGEGGSQLSGGQKQRIAIARSALQNPRILLLDESTSALDRQNERLIQKTLDEFSKNRTTITIAHRLSTIVNSDVIFMLEKGHVVEYGTHMELLSRNGPYAKLIKNQLSSLGIKNSELLQQEGATNNKADAEIEMALKMNPEVVSVDSQYENLEEKKLVSKKEDIKLKSKLPEKDKPKDTPVFSRLFGYVKGSHKFLIFVGSLFSLVNGALMPIFALYLADMIDVFSKFEVLKTSTSESYTIGDLNSEVNRIAITFLVLAGIALVANFLQLHLFNLVGCTVTFNLRNDLFSKLLKKTMIFFDKEKHNAGILSSKLGSDCLIVNAIVSTSIGAILQGFGSLICGLIIAFFASWRLALIGLFGCPLIVVAGIIQSKMMMQGKHDDSSENEEKQKNSDVKIFQESATNMRTISAINCQFKLQERYDRIVEGKSKTLTKSSVGAGLLYGLGQASMFLVYAAIFYAGARFTVQYGLKFQDLFRALFSIIFAAFGAGMSQQFLPDMGTAYNAAKSVFEIIDHPIEINYLAQGKKPEIKGRIEFKDVYFRYPGRDNPVFDGLNLVIEPNQKVAFAGPSGTGKSTIFSLLLRFYDPERGQIFIDGLDIKEFDIQHLRNAFGMVGQEPRLFNSTINYNIK